MIFTQDSVQVGHFVGGILEVDLGLVLCDSSYLCHKLAHYLWMLANQVRRAQEACGNGLTTGDKDKKAIAFKLGLT